MREILDATLVLPTMEDVRAAVSANMRDEWKKQKHPFAFRIRAEWLVDLIGEIEASGQYPYNALVKKEAESRLGMPLRPREADYCNEGDTLSLLIYNASCFRRSDAARVAEAKEAADGWLRPTEDWLRERLGAKVDVLGQLPARVAVINGKLCLRPYRSRIQVYVNERVKVRDLKMENK